MKRNERRLLEEKLRYIAMEDIELDPEREHQMLEQAKAALMRQGTEPTAKRPARHGMGRRVLIVSAAAVLIMVLSFGFTVLMPESVSHARGFVRTAAIWVNNTLHLGYEFEEPMEKTNMEPRQLATYSTLDEATENIPYPLFYLDNQNFELISIYMQNVSAFDEVVITYRNGLQECSIMLSPTAESTSISLDNDTYTTIPWEHGELICWENPVANYALTYYSGMEIMITGISITYNDFLALCQTLKMVN